MNVKKGDKVKVEYTGTFETGEVFDASEKHEAPLEFEVGAGQMIKGFDEAVLGMAKDEEKEITLRIWEPPPFFATVLMLSVLVVPSICDPTLIFHVSCVMCVFLFGRLAA